MEINAFVVSMDFSPFEKSVAGGHQFDSVFVSHVLIVLLGHCP